MQTKKDASSPAKNDTITLTLPTLQNAATPLLIVLLMVACVVIGVLGTTVYFLQKDKTTGVLAAGQANPSGVPQPTVAQRQNVQIGSLPILGNKDAKVTVVEFSDLQCLYCRKFWKDILPDIKKNYIDTGKIKFSYRHYPLPPEIHPMAQTTAEASECANEQGKFWEFHDKAFAEQAKQGTGTISYTIDDIKQWAVDIGLDASQFNSCLDDGKYTQKVKDDAAAGQQVGVSGTPTTFINGMPIVGAAPYSAFSTIIDQELAKK